MLRPLTLAALTAGALSFSTVASAHNVWLLPSATVLAKAETITVDAAVSNDLFFFNHVPLSLDNLRIEGPDGRLLQAENPHRGKLRSVFDLKVEQPGSHRLAVVNRASSPATCTRASASAGVARPRRWPARSRPMPAKCR
ncbi:MAG: DUF4198 domain-containing protein [Azospira sp.]|nr:DUF4198 domain-containing protein [Azospira sp.]